MNIYVKERFPINNIKDVIRNMYSDKFQDEVSWVYHIKLGLPTYFDKECKKQQCATGKWRSADDIIIACRTYFPDADLKDIMSAIIKPYIEDDIKMYPFFVFCDTLNKPTLVYSKKIMKYDQFALRKAGDSVMSWMGLLNTMEIKKTDEIDQYLNNYNFD